MDTLQSSIGSLFEFLRELGAFLFSHTADTVNAVVEGFSRGGLEAAEGIFPLVILMLQLYLVFVVLKVLRMIWILSQGVSFVWHRPKRYSVQRAGGKRILIIGDSTAYGVGADKPEDSIAGRLGHDFPNTEIVNLGTGGSRVKDATRQLKRTNQEKFHLILISTGGNDIWHFTQLASLERDLTLLLQEAVQKSDHRVVLLFYANMGDAPVFPRIIRTLLSKRTEKVHEVFSKVSSACNVPLIELYTSKKINTFGPNPFFENPKRYYSKDLMHPNSEGYRLWYNRMWGEMIARNITFKE